MNMNECIVHVLPSPKQICYYFIFLFIVTIAPIISSPIYISGLENDRHIVER